VGDLVELYVLFALIYLFECGEIVPRRARGLVPFLGQWRARRTFVPNTTWRRGLLFGEPWPPLAPTLVTEPAPVVVGPDGLGGTGDGARFLPWADVEQVAADGARLSVNGETVAELATRRGARALADAFAGLAKLPRDEREARLARWLDARFDHQTARARLPVLWRETRALRIAANVMWAGLFVGLPAVFWTSLAPLFLAVGAVSVVAWLTTAVLFERALRRSSWLGRELRPDFAKRVTAVASPLATIRSADHIARELCGDLDPFALAVAVLPRSGLRRLGRSLLCDLRYRAADDVPAGGEAAAGWMRAQILARVERALRASDIDPQALIVAPARDGDMAAWCPRCLAQYRQDAQPPLTSCANEPCRGISLIAF
jgi:hypothetical protein